MMWILYQQEETESNGNAFPALAIKWRFEFHVFFDEKERIPQVRPVGRERYKEESAMHSDVEPGIIEMFDADVEEIGRR